MRKKRWILPFLLSLQVASAQSLRHDLTGIWQNEREDRRSVSIFTPTHYIGVSVTTDRILFAGETPTEDEKAAAFDDFQAGAGTWACEGKRCTLQPMFEKNHDLVGTSISFEYEVEGNLWRYWIIQPDGTRGPEGRLRKLAEWDAPSNCNDWSGVWMHQDIRGLYIQSGNYGAFVNILDPDLQPEAGQPESPAEKARAFDAFKAAFYVSHCDGQGKVDNVLLLSDPTFLQGQVWRSAPIEWKEGYAWFYLQDADGQPMGDGMRLTRLDAGKGPFSVPHRGLPVKHDRVLSNLLGSFLSSLQLAMESGLGPEEYGYQLGHIFKNAWDQEAGYDGFVWGNLYNLADFSHSHEDLQIMHQSENSIELAWKPGWEGLLNQGIPFVEVGKEDFYAFFDGIMQPIADHMGANYAQERQDENTLLISIHRK